MAANGGYGSDAMMMRHIDNSTGSIQEPMNYCPVCNREYKQRSGYQTGRCPVCGSTLLMIASDELARLRERKKSGKTE